MKCRLLGTMRTKGDINPKSADCIEEECGQWDDSAKQCCFTALSQSVGELVELYRRQVSNT